ncbi:FRG domain-containing protein [Agrobacterium rosae]|uniref:FRG domain-containing protein n=1 Tax=Agrobacterium rosae TaxID=1972867 RepID=UPI00122EDC16|nr:FRG domain-containing protein [Agrobacterium rosae]KAA3509209.1 FRG domain-containing protein [Agrobacterium rosae]KAA3513903.1 FRG domain-containing protein [Agrobacterium rosae]MQB50922.1 FRG domain-containing protein [Agrobacterium rosae]
MLNLIIRANFEDYRKSAGEIGSSSFEIARFLEYTEKSIEAEYLPVTDETLSRLRDFPTVFMSEMQSLEDDDLTYYVDCRLGRIKNVSVKNRDIRFDFEITHVFNRMEFVRKGRSEFEKRLGLGSGELYRTHWALKTISLQEFLNGAGLSVPEDALDETITINAVAPMATAHVDVGLAPISTSMMVGQDIPEVNSISDFLREIGEINSSPDVSVFYRGHYRNDYSLTPTLFRKHPNGTWKWLTKEDVIVRELMSAQAREFANDRSMLDHLVRMQHYGLPTRLLDLTSNPLIALYFSCADPKAKDDDKNKPGQVIILTTKAKEVKYFDSDKISLISCVTLLTNDQKNNIDKKMSVDDFKEEESCKRLLDFVRREKPHFQDKIDPSDLSEILFVRGRSTHERIASQAGAFLVFGINAELPETGISGLDIHRINVVNKAGILEELAKLNIKASTVYPGLERAAEDIKASYMVAET